MKPRNLFVQSANESSPVHIIGDTTDITTTASNDTSVEFVNTVDLEEVAPAHSNGQHLIGPILGGLGIFIILLLYILGQRKEERERKEKALQETKKEEMKRKVLKDNMNINICEVVPTPHIDDEEAQHQQNAIFKSHEDGDEYCSTTDDSLDDQSQSAAIDQSRSHSNKTQLQDAMCPICHEEFQDGDELALSRNEACCHTAFHSECILSWLMSDHKECPICRSDFVVENIESED
ncbi:hypothetical protein CTEN210_11613 [Chaetoceros tenuissimus]|uniref:RING-type domain-containing protein n=1 Tax=Chaetoceros tenuissimus TaxID=426638 RepID=A0AAD3CZK7_9STRA|nr:hypothetical protein CTEN210_11613 [Chaetoceros tenuissimus]